MRNLSSVDLNLLIAFEAMLVEGNVSRAAARIGVAQPTMSGALARLRELFHDELFIRTSSGMKPTSRALEVADSLGKALSLIRETLSDTHTFNPASSQRRFTLGATEHSSFAFLPGVIRKFGEAPHVGMTVNLMPWREAIDDLENGRIDIVIGSIGPMPKTVEFRHARSDRLVCIARRGDIEPGRMSIDEYVGRYHAVRIDNEYDVVDEALAQKGQKRRVRFALQNFLAVGLAVASSDVLATLPSSAACVLAEQIALDVHELPIEVPILEIGLAWCRHRNVDAGLTWFRDSLSAAIENTVLPAVASQRPSEAARSRTRAPRVAQ